MSRTFARAADNNNNFNNKSHEATEKYISLAYDSYLAGGRRRIQGWGRGQRSSWIYRDNRGRGLGFLSRIAAKQTAGRQNVVREKMIAYGASGWWMWKRGTGEVYNCTHRLSAKHTHTNFHLHRRLGHDLSHMPNNQSFKVLPAFERTL